MTDTGCSYYLKTDAVKCSTDNMVTKILWKASPTFDFSEYAVDIYEETKVFTLPPRRDMKGKLIVAFTDDYLIENITVALLDTKPVKLTIEDKYKDPYNRETWEYIYKKYKLLLMIDSY